MPGKLVVMFGGHPTWSDTWAWDGKTWTQLSEVGPPGRENAGLAGSPDAMVLFGGSGAANVLVGMWQFDGKLWTQRQDIGPGARLGHALIFDSDRQRVVLFGGSSKNEGNDLSALLADTWEHETDQASPPPPVSVASLQLTPNSGNPGDVVVANHTLTGPSPTPTLIQIGITDPSGKQILLPSVPFPANVATFTVPITVPYIPTFESVGSF
jgi:hypothetical protein